MSNLFKKTIDFIKSLYPNDNPVPLHAPRFLGKEKQYLLDCIDTTYVSYVGKYVNKFEDQIQNYTGAKHAIAVSSGSAALYISLLIAKVAPGEEVITQALTFVATANAIVHCSAHPIFVDVEHTTLGLDPEKLENFLINQTILKPNGCCYNKTTRRRVAACVPVHTFGHPMRIDRITAICKKYNIPVIEDAAEALGSFYKDQHVGTYGEIGILSFNGNKPLTTGGGGMITTNDESIAAKARHLTTTAKKPHPWEFDHDEVGYNYRMPNINDAIGCAQIERLNATLKNKRITAHMYKNFFQENNIQFITEPTQTCANYWLNAIVLKDKRERDQFLSYASTNKVQARPVWTIMPKLPMYRNCQCTSLSTAKSLEDQLVNIPSSIRI